MSISDGLNSMESLGVADIGHRGRVYPHTKYPTTPSRPWVADSLNSITRCARRSAGIAAMQQAVPARMPVKGYSSGLQPN